MEKNFKLPGFTAELIYSVAGGNYLKAESLQFQHVNLVLMQRLKLPNGMGGNVPLSIGEIDACKTTCMSLCALGGTNTWVCGWACDRVC